MEVIKMEVIETEVIKKGVIKVEVIKMKIIKVEFESMVLFLILSGSIEPYCNVISFSTTFMVSTVHDCKCYAGHAIL